MTKPKKKNTRLGLDFKKNPETLDKLRYHSYKTRKSMNKIATELIEKFLKKHGG